jgi:hypothetical protein
MKVLALIWGAVLLILAGAFITGQLLEEFAHPNTFPLVAAITAFAAFVVQSLFSFSVLSHNAVLREMSEETRKNSAEANARAEAFRSLQFVSSNYTVVDFVDFMSVYEEYERYREILRARKDFTFYMKEENIEIKDVVENFGNYKFITIRLPIMIVEGKAVGKIKFSKMKFVKERGTHQFFSCMKNNNSLIILNEGDRRSEVIVNLVMKKDSEFHIEDGVTPLLKVKMWLTVQSLLGVVVEGWIELFFSKSELIENGVSKYKISSSHFEIAGLPTLLNSVDMDINNLTNF